MRRAAIAAGLALISAGASASAQPAPAAPPQPAPAPAAQPAPVPMPVQPPPPPAVAAAPIAVLDTVAIGVDPVVGSAVTKQLRTTAQALGYSPLPPDVVRSGLGLFNLSTAPVVADAGRVAERLHVSRGVLATVRATGGAYVVKIEVASADQEGPWSAEDRAMSADLPAVVDRLLRATLPWPGASAPPGGSAPIQPEGPTFDHYRIAFQVEGAYGIPRDSFHNYLAGARVDYRFTPVMSLGAYLGYANLKGKSGRVGNVLPYLLWDYRLRWSDTSALAVPLRYGAGYLPKNGPFMRLSAGLAIRASDRVDLVLDVLAPTFWVTRDKPVVSFDLAAEVSIVL